MNKLILLTLPLLLLTGCQNSKKNKTTTSSKEEKIAYGVFLSVDKFDAKAKRTFAQYDEIVIDAQYFEKDEISNIKSNGSKVYSYINVGALENFRDYYDDYKQYGLGEYEHWDEEIWMDVTKPEWQSFLVDDLAYKLSVKGIDGLFVDNLDVYYEYPSEDIFVSITEILKGFKAYGLDIIVNGGDTYVSKYLHDYHKLDDVMDAVNQETVFSSIDWDKGTFSTQNSEEREYFQDYLSSVSIYLKDVYLLEYTKDNKLIKEIDDYCSEHGYKYYISSSLELSL